jgi:hypothetical protein
MNQAIHDAIYNGLDKYHLINKREAIQWLMSNSIDFKTICNFADIDYGIANRKFIIAMQSNVYAFKEEQNKVLNKPRKEYKKQNKFRLTFYDT